MNIKEINRVLKNLQNKTGNVNIIGISIIRQDIKIVYTDKDGALQLYSCNYKIIED